MKKLAFISLAFVGLLLSAGCKSSTPTLSTISCATPAGAGHTCETASAVAGESCPSGTSSVSSCPSGIGTCTQSEAGVSAAVTYYSDSGESASTAQSACTAGGGTWKAGS